jgi:hypothetical protein
MSSAMINTIWGLFLAERIPQSPAASAAAPNPNACKISLLFMTMLDLVTFLFDQSRVFG